MIGRFFGSVARFWKGFISYLEDKGRLEAETTEFKAQLSEKQKEIEELKASHKELESQFEVVKSKLDLIDFLGGFEEMKKLIDYGSFSSIIEKIQKSEKLSKNVLEVDSFKKTIRKLTNENKSLKDQLKKAEGDTHQV
ncbi:hypothetical protein HF1_10940 [Mycoplasma haemofelis str. Langford 1]|uniref:Uncharacterized protein n=2 Tax=Mycoplasma haemofelis TaxID=29501 RepID=F6FJR9_MYCHI|nr:hypothetical protein [Mycoplasma haemofelis]AEG73424.1 hypothetical protein MHF_1183 [Mycoplasma haemofelis Ohio2]CBY93102.1 hypothetical protein HF1_10940 [Mycoplasma haemofelis str. Langford 1]